MISRKHVTHGQTEEHETFVCLGFGAETTTISNWTAMGSIAVCASAVVTKNSAGSGNTCGEDVPTNQTRQESSESSGSCGTPLGRGRMVGAHQARGLSRTAQCAAGSFVHARVSAFVSLAQRG